MGRCRHAITNREKVVVIPYPEISNIHDLPESGKRYDYQLMAR